MPRKVLITAPVPTLEETAREIGLSHRRALQIAGIMDDIVRRRRASVRRSPRKFRAARRTASKRVAGPHRSISRL